jgi:DNA-binding NarL/FixJ family response regulator
MRPRVVIADDHRAVQDAVKSLLAPHFDIVGAADDGCEALRLATTLAPDAVVLDLAMPGLDGLAVVEGMRRAGVTAAVVILTVSEDPAIVEAALAAGARGFVTKTRAATDLVAAVGAALGGRRFVSATTRRPPGARGR